MTDRVLLSSGAQRATQTLACFLSGEVRSTTGVEIDSRFRSDVEDRWRDAYERADAGEVETLPAP